MAAETKGNKRAMMIADGWGSVIVALQLAARYETHTLPGFLPAHIAANRRELLAELAAHGTSLKALELAAALKLVCLDAPGAEKGATEQP